MAQLGPTSLYLKPPSNQNRVLLVVTSSGWFSLTVQNDLCAKFDTKGLFSHSSAEGGKFLWAHMCVHPLNF